MFGIGSVVGFILDDSHVKRQRLFLKRKKKEDIQGGVRLRLIGPSRITWIAKDVPGTEKRRRKTALPFLETLRPRVKILVETAMPLLYFSFSHYTHSLTANCLCVRAAKDVSQGRAAKGIAVVPQKDRMDSRHCGSHSANLLVSSWKTWALPS